MRISDCSSDVCSSDLLNWLNAENVPFYGDLVYPVGYEPGRRYPMVIVQYRTKGFLRGGIGDEVPIQTLAGRDRKSVVSGKSVSVRVDLGGSSIIKKKQA